MASSSRERIFRAEDISSAFARRRSTIRETGIMPDEEGAIRAIPGPVAVTGGSGSGNGRVETRRTRNDGRGSVNDGSGSGRGSRRGRRGRGSPSNSVLPVWYPRTPLRDITDVVRAIERRRARLAATEQDPQNEEIPAVPVINVQAARGAHLEHNLSRITPHTTLPINNQQPIGNPLQILLDKTNKDVGESQILTPQKQVLNMVDTFGKVVLEDLQKLKITPTAKKAERERKMRVLRSMR